MWKIVLLISLLSFSVQGQVNKSYFGRANENNVFRAMNQIHGSQMTYQATTGAGNFAGLIQVLVISGFLDTNYFSGENYGYRFAISATPATSPNNPAKYFATATPIQYSKITRKSFYVDESGIIRGGDINGAVATINEPIIYLCGNNESQAIANLRTLIGAEYTFAATSGFGNYGSLSQLAQNSLINSNLANGQLCGYNFKIQFTSQIFHINATPQYYSVSGNRSFYTDQTGIIRGADKQGLPADENDLPIQ